MDPIIEKSAKVILSCQTKEQLAVAIIHADLAFKQYTGIDKLGKALLPLEMALFLKRYLIENNISDQEVT